MGSLTIKKLLDHIEKTYQIEPQQIMVGEKTLYNANFAKSHQPRLQMKIEDVYKQQDPVGHANLKDNIRIGINAYKGDATVLMPSFKYFF